MTLAMLHGVQQNMCCCIIPPPLATEAHGNREPKECLITVTEGGRTDSM